VDVKVHSGTHPDISGYEQTSGIAHAHAPEDALSYQGFGDPVQEDEG